MANKKDGNQKTQTKTITKKTTTNSNKKSTNKPAVKSTKSTAKKSSLAKKTTTVTKKAPVKNIDKDLEKTIIIVVFTTYWNSFRWNIAFIFFLHRKNHIVYRTIFFKS